MKKPEPKRRGHQQCDRETQTAVKIDKVIAARAECSHKDFAIGPQHVNGRDHHAPKPKHGGDLKNVETFDFPAVLERAKENHHFAGKISETGKTNCGKGAKAKGESGEGHYLAEATKIIKEQGIGALAHFTGNGKKKRDRNAMGKYQDGRSARSENICAGYPEKNVAHVHDARVTKHPIESLLRDRDQPDVNDIPEEQHHEQARPMPCTLRKQWHGQAQQAIKSEFF